MADEYQVPTANGGSLPSVGSQHALAARQPLPPEYRTPNAGGRSYFAPPGGPGLNAGGAFAMTTPGQTYGKPLGGGPKVAEPYHWEDYTGAGAPRPRSASVSAPGPSSWSPPPIMGGEALDAIMSQHQPAQQQMPSLGGRGGRAGEAEGEMAGAEGEGAAADAGAGAEAAGAAETGPAEGVGSIVEALGFL
jgi:hypothetical protein